MAADTVFGSYIHGIFDSGTLATKLIRLLFEKKGLTMESSGDITLEEYKEQQYDKLADMLRSSLDMDLIYQIIENGIG